MAHIAIRRGYNIPLFGSPEKIISTINVSPIIKISPKDFPGIKPKLLIKEGDYIKKGQVICIIEAMKIFNEIESEYSGRVKKILIKDSTPVEYDQNLIIISTE